MNDENSARSKIKSAYLQYLNLKPYNKIKVSDIISTADINRSTFYRNYEDIFELYEDICNEEITSILNDIHPMHSSEDVRIAAFAAKNKAMKHIDKIKLLCGKNGNLQFLYKLRNEYFDAMKKNAEEAYLWDEDRHYIVSFSADYLILYLSREISENRPDINLYDDIDYTYYYDIDPIDNVTSALKKLNCRSVDFQTAIFLSVIKKFSFGDFRHSSITDLFSFSGFSRTEFYRFYTNKYDYFKKLEDAIYLILSKTVIPLLLENKPECLNDVLDNWDKYHNDIEKTALLKGVSGGYLLDMGTRVLSHIFSGYMDKMQKKLGRSFTDDEEAASGFFVCSAICCFVYYVADSNKEQYFKRINTLFEFKEKMLNEEKNENE